MCPLSGTKEKCLFCKKLNIRAMAAIQYEFANRFDIEATQYNFVGGCEFVSDARGGNFSIGFSSGAVASFMSTTADVLTQNLCEAWQVTCMVAAGGLSGGVTASMAGGSFWDGVCNGLICSGLNHALHMIAGPDDPPSPEEMKQRVKNLVKAQLSLKISFSSKALFDKKSGHWMGKNGKFYSMKWGGNKYTGGKYKFAQRASNVLKNVNKAIAVYEVGEAVYSRINGIISTSEMINEIGFTVGTSVTGSIGAAIGVGRALSDVVISTEWYQDFKFNVNYDIMEHKIGTPNESNQLQWMYFINNYE